MEDQIGPIATIRPGALGWKGIQNGALLALAQQSEFEVLITSDKNLTYQQSQAGRHTHQDKALAGKNLPFIVILGLDPRIIARTLRVDLTRLPRGERSSGQARV